MATYTTVTARLWPWFSNKSPWNVSSRSLFALLAMGGQGKDAEEEVDSGDMGEGYTLHPM
jgi:hypothetical protein